MAEPINLNRARKARARAADKTQAQQNRVRFGRPKAEQAVAKAERDQAERRVAAHRLERTPPDED